MSVLEEVVKGILEEFIGAGLSGAFRKARSRKSRILKAAAWICLGGSLFCFMTASLVADAETTATVAGGVVGILGFFAFGCGAALINARVEINGD